MNKQEILQILLQSEIDLKKREIEFLENELKSTKSTSFGNRETEYNDAVEINEHTAKLTPEEVFINEFYTKKEVLPLLPYKVSYTTLNKQFKNTSVIKYVRKLNQPGKGSALYSREDVIAAIRIFWDNIQGFNLDY